MRGPCAIVAASVIAAAAAVPAGWSLGVSRPPAEYDAPTERWREGPVRYLLTKTEDDAYRLLSTETERADFIKKFWDSRDPVATTTDNEYRIQFYARVAQANRMFTDSTKPGWKTDRGKIYTLLGPPDDLEQEQYRDGFVPDVITWTYRSGPGGPYIDSLPVVRFIRDATGEYRLSNSVFVPGFESNTGITFQLQAMQMKSLPEQKKVLDTIVLASDRFDAGPFRTHRDFFRAADGTSLAVLTLGVQIGRLNAKPAAAGPRPAPPEGATAASSRERYEAMARLVGASPDLPTYDFTGTNGLHGGESGPVNDSAGYRLFQGALAVRPGRYTAYYGIVDHDDGQVHSFRDTVDVPDLRLEHLALSPITLASRLERVDGNSHVYSAPFVLGDLRVLPRPDDLFKNGEELAFYYQVYGSTTDPIDGRPDFDVEYQFFVAQDDGSGGLRFVPLGKSIRQLRQRGQVQGYAFPLNDWRRATYRLRVRVKDNLSEEWATEEISFRVL